ncbi:MAG: SRPBCC family protein [Actinobacteria bacterium]|nr:SRPBCC family protein [Actinomycetota bacterium]
MEMDHAFTVPVPPDQAWDVLLDVERIAPCMPGATVEEFDGEVVTGRIKVKVGPVSLTYRGTAKFIERDPAAQVVVLEAAGKETRGAGTATATVMASLEPADADAETKVIMRTVMNVTGRPAQFGRGVMVEVGGKLVERFAGNLAALIAGDGAAVTDAGRSGQATADTTAGATTAGASTAQATTTGATTTGATTTGATTAETATTEAPAGSAEAAATVPVARTTTVPPPARQQDEHIHLITLVGPAVLKRVVPVAIAAAGLVLAGYGLGRRQRRGGSEQA